MTLEKGDFIHRYTPPPDTAPKDHPTLLLLHGTGGNEDDLLQLGRELAPKAALLSPRGKILENGMPRFFRRLEGVFDIPDLINQTHELATFIETSSRKYGFDPALLIALGYSNGANIAASLIALHPRLIRAAILLRATVHSIPKQLPDLTGVKILILEGLRDPLIPREEAEQLANRLKQAHAQVTLHWDESTHAVTSREVSVARDWLASIASSG